MGHVGREIKLKVCVNSEADSAALVHHMLLSGEQDFSPIIRLLWEFHCCFAALDRGFA